MPTKKDLSTLWSEAPQQPLRRGRGLRLSQASRQARELASKAAGSHSSTAQPQLSTPAVQPSAEPPSAADARAAEAPAVAAFDPVEPITEAPTVEPPPSAPDAVAAKAAAVADLSSEPPEPEREKRKIQLRMDLLKQCKRLARAQDRKLYQVIESALEEYIKRHGGHE